jgi:hypothetical protein
MAVTASYLNNIFIYGGELMENRLVMLALVVSVLMIFAMVRGNKLSSAEPPQESVDQIIDNFVRACGGKALAEIKSEVAKGTLVRGTSGKVPLEIVANVSGKWRFNQTFAWGDQVRFGYDGTVAWEQDSKGVRKMNPQQLLDLQLIADFQSPLKMRERYREMTIVGTDSIDLTEVVVVSATSPDKISTELAFDRETGFLVRAGQMQFLDYRSVGKVKRPFKIILGTDEPEVHRQLVMEFSEIRHDIEVADSVFDEPTCALPPTDPPINKLRKQVEVSDSAIDACVGFYQSVKDTNIVLSFVRQGNHLMCGIAGRLGGKVEIKPESETDYFTEFTGQEFHFVKDESGRVIAVELGADRAHRANRIK